MSGGPQRLAELVIAVWIGVQAVALLRGVLPLPPPWSGQLPWRMFSEPSPIDTSIHAAGLTAEGRWVEIPLERYFRHTRGATGERAYDFSAVVVEPGRLEERHAFARWLAARMAEDGTPLRRVRIVRRWRDVRDGSTGERRIGQYRVDDDAG